jgi:hypothetical protein
VTRLALIAALLCYYPANAAPVPPPRPMTAELMPGLYDYQWGGMGKGWILLTADGHYLSCHSPCVTPSYAGTWEYSGDRFTLFEGCAHGDGDEWCSEYRTRYTVTVKQSSAAGLVGVYSDGVVVTLSNPKR